MQKTLRLLIELQEIEKKVQSLVEQKAQAPIQIAALQEDEKAAGAQLSEKRKMLESLSRSRRQLELQVEELEGRRAKSKQKLLDVKSNKEYQATLKEIDDLGELVRVREDQILEQMELAERIGNQILEQERLVAEARQRLDREGAQLEMDAEKADQQMAILNKHKERLKPQIPADLLQKYQFLRVNRAGVALALVSRGTCQVCHMNLPPQLCIDLQRNEQMLYCPNCQRIIYWEGHEAYQLSSEILGEQD